MNRSTNIQVSRRSFLKQASAASAAAVCAPLILPATALGRGDRPAPGERITLGCIGLGSQGKHNMRSFLRRDQVQVVAVCDVDRRRMEDARDVVNKHYRSRGAGRSFRGCDMHHAFEHLLERDDIDAVSIGTPDHWHALIAVAAARAGKDVYCEKPVSLTIPEGRAISDAVARYQRVWQTGSWQRSQRDFRFACELVRNGRIGKLHTVRVGVPDGKRGGSAKPAPVPEGFDYDRWLGPAPHVPYTRDRTHWDFRWQYDYSGGIVTDWGAHHCDIAHWGMDCERSGPVKIEGKGDFPTEGLWDMPDTFEFTCTYRDGVIMTVSSRNRPNRQGVRFEGDEGWVFVNRDTIEAHPRSLLGSVIRHDEVRLYRSHNHIDNFLDCVRTRAETVTPAEIAHRSATVCHLGNIAMQMGRKVRWNPDTERFVDDPAAERLRARAMREPWRL